MKFSMIVPLYHGEKYIAALIDMACTNQKSLGAAHELELIFVNDSPECAVNQNQFSCDVIKLFFLENESNQGIHASRIAGVHAAQGQYILLLDQDDSIAPDFFLSQSMYVHRKADVVVANGVTEYPEYDKQLYRFGWMQWTAKHSVFYALFDCRILSPGQCLLRKSAIPAQWFENSLRQNGADDMLLWLMLLSQKATFVLNRKCLYRHRYTAQNVSLDARKMTASLEEMLEIAQRTRTVPNRILRLMQSRIAYQKGEKSSVFWQLMQTARNSGEYVNRV